MHNQKVFEGEKAVNSHESGKWSAPSNGSEVPQIKVKRNDEDTEYNEEEETEERTPVKKLIHNKLEWKRLKNKTGKTPEVPKRPSIVDDIK